MAITRRTNDLNRFSWQPGDLVVTSVKQPKITATGERLDVEIEAQASKDQLDLFPTGNPKRAMRAGSFPEE